MSKLNKPEELPSTAASAPRVWVGKSDGSKQCEPKSGVPIETMAKELKGLTIFNQKSGHDGRMRAQMCGLATGRMHLFEIAQTDLDAALKLGFTKEEKAP